MKRAILKGDSFNPWQLEAFQRYARDVECTVFTTAAGTLSEAPGDLRVEALQRDDTAGPLFARWRNRLAARSGRRTPRILPFHARLEDFDVLQTWELFSDLSDEAAEARLRFGSPLAVTVWDNIPFNMERDPARRALKARVAMNADRFIVHTERSRRTLDIEGVDAGKVVRIDPGVDTDRFAPGERNRADLGVNDEDFVILFAGWFLPRKGIDFLLLALRELIRDPALSAQRQVRLLVVGAGPGKERIARLAARLGVHDACVFTGEQPYTRMPAVFRAADAFVLPGITDPEWQEHFGMLLIEGLACGVPVVSTQSGAASELAEDAALLCAPNDFVSMYETLKELVIDETCGAELGERGRALAVRRYRIENYAAALREIYTELLTGR